MRFSCVNCLQKEKMRSVNNLCKRETVKVAPTNMLALDAFVGVTFTVTLMRALIIYRNKKYGEPII